MNILMMSLLLTMIIYFLFYCIFYKTQKNMENISSYECGFNFYSKTRMTFSYRFFMIAILFIIFDVEISLMLSVPFFMGSLIGFWGFLFFIWILIVGLMYEYYYGSLEWLNIVIKS